MITGFFDYNDGTGEHEISAYIVALNKNKKECSGDYHHAVDQVRITLLGNLDIIQNLNVADKPIKARLLKDGSPFFTGFIPPTESLSTEGRSLSGSIANNIDLEILDRTTLLEISITPDDNLVFEAFYVLNPADKSHSIVHQLLYKCGFIDAEIDDSITIAIALLAWSREEGIYKDHLDQLLWEYGYYFDFDDSGKIVFKKWISTSVSPIGALEDHIKGTLKIEKRELSAEGILVEWYSLKEKEDVLLHMADLPFGDDNLRSGWPIQPGFLYPEEANAQTTFQEYQDSGTASSIVNKTVQKDSDFSQLVLTKNHNMDESFEDGIVREITVFQNKRAQIAYRNTDPENPKLIFNSNIRGDVIYKGAKNETKAINVTGTKRITTVPTESIHDEFSASAFAQGLANSLRNSGWEYSFESDSLLPTGSEWTLEEESTDTDCVVRIIERGENVDDETYTYVAIIIAELDEVEEETISTVLPEAPESNNSNPLQQLSNVPKYYELDHAGWNNAQATNIPSIPVFVTQGVFKGITLLIARQTMLTNFLRYEIQVSEDEESWYALGLIDGWHGALDGVTESSLDYHVHAGIQPSGTTEEPEGRALFYRVRRVTKALAYSAWSASVSATTSVIETADLAENSVTANKLVTGLLSALIAQISESLIVSSDYGWQAGNYVSPVRGNKRSFVRQDEMALQEYDGTNWIYKVLMGWITDRYGIKAENIEAIEKLIQIGRTLLIDQETRDTKVFSGYNTASWGSETALADDLGQPFTMDNGQIVFVKFDGPTSSYSIRFRELDGTLTAAVTLPNMSSYPGDQLFSVCSDVNGTVYFTYRLYPSLNMRILSRTIGGAWTDHGVFASGSQFAIATQISSIKITGQNKILFVLNLASANNTLEFTLFDFSTFSSYSRAYPTALTTPFLSPNLTRTEDGTIRLVVQNNSILYFIPWDTVNEIFGSAVNFHGGNGCLSLAIGNQVLVSTVSLALGNSTLILTFEATTYSINTINQPEEFSSIYRTSEGIVHAWDSFYSPTNERVLNPFEKVVNRVEIGDIVSSARSTKRHCLLCDGSAVSRSVYSELFSAIGTAFGVGNGTTTFNLPDMRAASPGGAGASSGYLQNETLTFGQKHDDRIQNITGVANTHAYQGLGIYPVQSDGAGAFYTDGTTTLRNRPAGSGEGSFETGIKFDASRVVRAGLTTRGKVVGLNFFIVYE